MIDEVRQSKNLDSAESAVQDATVRNADESRNAKLLSAREFFDRIGYGVTTSQFINILFWIFNQANPFIMLIVGLLNGLRTVISVLWSEFVQEYAKLHKVSKNVIAGAGIFFGFSFLFMAFGLLLHSMTLFSLSFILGTFGLVAYGDLYNGLVKDTVRKERTGWLFQSLAHWGVIITAIALLAAGIILDLYPMQGLPFTLNILGHSFNMNIYGYLVIFEITAFVFIISGYLTSLVSDRRESRRYPFKQFVLEHFRILFFKTKTIWRNKYVAYLLLASFLAGLFQLAIAAYSGIAMYEIIQPTTSAPFFTLAVIFAIAILAAFTGPFFTEKIHTSIGLTPTLVFGTMLMAIFPITLVFKSNIYAIATALCLYVIGASIVGFGHGLLAKKLMDDETRKSYFQVQAVLVMIPYLIMIPIMAFIANSWPLSVLFGITAIGLLAIVMPIYFILVLFSQKQKW